MSASHGEQLARALLQTYDYKLGVNDSTAGALPDRESVAGLCRLVIDLLFPGYFSAGPVRREHLDLLTRQNLVALEAALLVQVRRALVFDARARGAETPVRLDAQVADLVQELLADVVRVRELLVTDVDAAFANDPAAANRETIIVSYPSIEALAVQRFAHRLYQRGVPLIPRMMTEVAHSRTGIDINPGARIGHSFFIDHGTGVVVGETAVVGDHCVLYQGVTLGAWNPLAKDDNGELTRGQANKRHPTLEDHVTVFPGATILGGDTVIGHHSVIGGNVWLTRSVAAHSVVTMKDPELLIRQRRAPAGGEGGPRRTHDSSAS